MRISRLATLIYKDLKKWTRDVRGIVLTIAVAILLPLFGYVIGGGFRGLPVGVVGEATNLPEVLTIKEYTNVDSAKADIINGRIYAVVTPQSVYIDNTNPPIATYIRTVFQERGIEVKPFWDKDYEYIHFFLPAVIVIVIFMAAYQAGGMPIVRDKESGVIAKYLVTPITRAEFLLGTIFGGFIKIIVPAFVSLGIAVFFLGSRYSGGAVGIVNILLVMIISTVGFLGLSIWLAFLLNYNLYYPLGVLFNMLAMVLSGLFYPIESLPFAMRFIARLNPMTHAIHAARVILMKDGSVIDLPFDLAYLSLFSAVMFILGIMALRRYSLEDQ